MEPIFRELCDCVAATAVWRSSMHGAGKFDTALSRREAGQLVLTMPAYVFGRAVALLVSAGLMRPPADVPSPLINPRALARN